MTVLGIESTCDETGAAVAKRRPIRSGGDVNSSGVVILSDIKASSAEIVAAYGGVVPEVAAREQVAAVIPVIEAAMKKSGISIEEIDAIAVSYGPGLIGSLLIGVETAKALALAYKKPLIRVNHMAAHVFANWISEDRPPELPAVALIVSGGHTDLMLLSSLTNWKWIGGTRDDAAGEAFDKAARAMGFPYPGGPLIAKAADEVTGTIPTEMKLPRPMIHDDSLEMSFSGLKTALIQVMEKNKEKILADHNLIHLLAKEFNAAVVEVLTKKTMKAVKEYSPKSLLVAGGVAANKMLRDGLRIESSRAGVSFHIPHSKYCTDNAAMIAACALMRPDYVEPLSLFPEPGLEVG